VADTQPPKSDGNTSLTRTPGGGLVNPLINTPELKEPAPGSRPALTDSKVREPRWQIIASLIIIAIILFLEFGLRAILKS